ncbi:DUF29 family protein [Azospirillum melinis]|uniref:DUF29 family protein n=1 Tax=Azospirillum melinis TaxID=328839 RepID=A0ABX2KDY4_9PROT|nr:DUF29 domain-containing protein [Azospirillum melinis]MBP2309851.1 hypothetical protein [Azospirillum melinis]NUA98854.1 DUF29 family protein [Azospirillum melinis]
MDGSSLYDSDFYAWANEQAALLRAGKLDAADIEHIAEEIESMGKTEKRELVSRLRVLLHHLLKWEHQPARRGNSWRLSIANSRDEIETHMRDNPSLKSKLGESIADAYRLARRDAAAETGIDEAVFAVQCPWSFAEMMDEGVWPEG